MSATEPRYCPVSPLLPAFAALPSIRRRDGGRPGSSVVSETAGDHRRDESCAPGRRCSPRHLRRAPRRSAANWRQRGNPAAATVCRRAGRYGCYCRRCQAPRQRSAVVGPARQEAPDHAREGGNQGHSEENASVAPAATENNADNRKEDYRYAASRQRKYRTGGAVSAGAHTPLPCAGIPT
jgi:hypothetical protein